MTQQNAIPENKMGTMPMNQLILSISVPMMISMLVQSLYNIVDSIYVSRIDEAALTAVSLVFPAQTLMISFVTGLGVGFSSLLSRSLGQKQFEKVHKSAMNGLLLEYIVAIVFVLIGLFTPKFFLSAQTDDPQIITYGVEYMTIILGLSFCPITQMSFERLLQSTGKTTYSMITQLTGTVINLVMDPVLIFGLWGFPKMGIRGAAIATVFGQVTAGIMAILFNLKVNKEIELKLRYMTPDPMIIREILTVGVPSIVMQAIGSVMTYAMNQILIAFTSTATAVFGIYFKLNSFLFMPIFGLNNGIVPIAAYNYGAGNKKRLIKTLHLGWAYAVTIMVIGLILFQTIPAFFLSLFNASEHMLAIGVPALRIISLSFPVAAYCMICGSLFQALGNGVYSMINSLIRQLFVLLPAAWLLAKTGNLNLVWWSFIIAEVSSASVTTYFLRKIFREVIDPMPDEAPVN